VDTANAGSGRAWQIDVDAPPPASVFQRGLQGQQDPVIDPEAMEED